ncbi:MAG: septal ring lytic transglycosylase RlpA family protein [Gammaproteobacteria bacterium]|jgi:rare lipoprotein A
MLRALQVTLSAAALLAVVACSSVEPQTVSVSEPAVVNPPRTARGNPAEYVVLGRRYRVMASGDGYRDTGVASWYGRDFHGKPTSSGERYDMFGMTAAHKTLPIPTWVEVTNQRNGRAVIVKVNDRGPFVDDRIIDLSYAAALELDMLNSGTAPVFVRALGAPATLPTVAGDSDQSAEERLVFAQVAAFSDAANAQRMVSRLQRSGFRNALVISGRRGADLVHRVRIGPLSSDSVFDTVREQLSGLGFTGAQMIVEFVRE